MIDVNLVHRTVWTWLLAGDNKVEKLYALSGTYNDEGKIKNDSESVVYSPVNIGKLDNVQEYIDGSFKFEYTFMLRQFIPINIALSDDINLLALQFFENLAKWIDENKDTLKIDNCDVSEIEVLAGNIAGQDINGAKLQIPIKITIKGE